MLSINGTRLLRTVINKHHHNFPSLHFSLSLFSLPFFSSFSFSLPPSILYHLLSTHLSFFALIYFLPYFMCFFSSPPRGRAGVVTCPRSSSPCPIPIPFPSRALHISHNQIHLTPINNSSILACVGVCLRMWGCGVLWRAPSRCAVVKKKGGGGKKRERRQTLDTHISTYLSWV